MTHDAPAYGLWGLVVLNAALFIAFAYSFAKPRTGVDWRSFGAFTAFVVALFAEMYGFPLTIYVLSGWLQSAFPGTDPLSHDAGHLWFTALGLEGNPHTHPIHLAANLLLIAGFLMLAPAWSVLHAAQQEGRLATEGPYASLRHPQYVAFIAILTGFFLMWPTLLTAVMYPLLVVRYVLLALSEEKDAKECFGAEWDAYAARTPRFFPRLFPSTPHEVHDA